MTDTMQLRKQNSGGFGSSGSSQENLSNVMYNAANYNTIMVEYENGNREMAVDVPASFVAQVITTIMSKYVVMDPTQWFPRTKSLIKLILPSFKNCRDSF